MKFAKLCPDGSVWEVAQADLSQYTPDVAAMFNTEVPDDIVAGATKVNGAWTNPPAPTPEPPAAPRFPLLTPMQFYTAFTVAEAIAIKAAATQGGAIGEFWDRYERAERTNTMIDPNSGSVVGALNALVAAKILTADRVPQIQAGVAQ